MEGYTGKLLMVDLTTGAIEEEPLNERYARLFLGGSGLAARYFYDWTPAEPLAPSNPLVFMTGPLTGTTAPSCGRYVVCARSPQTGLWGEANAGGFFGPELRFTGYDGIVFRGRASSPVYLAITDGKAELRDASHLWGQDTYRTQELIREELREPEAKVACIGPAGERLVKFAAIMNDHGRAAGRTGLGAVMGSKRLKAVAVRGRGSIPLADARSFLKISREAVAFLKEDLSAQMLHLGGTAFYVDMAMMYGDLPIRYWTWGEWEGAERINGATLTETLLVDNAACFGCPIACGRRVRLPTHGLQADGPEYETIGSFGTMLLIDDLEGIAYLGHLCNLYGLDTISAGCTIALAFYLFEQGLITEADTGGLTLEWGNLEAAVRLVETIAHREALGDLLAEGSLALARRYKAEELAVQVRGLEVPMHDPRAFVGMALSYATSPRGACHLQSDVYLVDIGTMVPELGILSSDRLDSSAQKAQIVARHQDWRSLYDAMVMCKLANPPLPMILGMLNAATGWGLEARDLALMGERIFNLKRLLNLRLGLDPAQDRLPPLLLQPLEQGGTGGNVPDMELLLREYYAFRGWDPATGAPTEEKRKELGL